MKYLFGYNLLENVQQSKKLLDELEIPHDNEDYLKIKELLKSNLGYVYWFTNQFFTNKIPHEELERIYSVIKAEPQIISKFSKPLISLETVEYFWDEYLKIKNKIVINKMYSEFPSIQRKLINLDNEEDQELLLDLSKDENRNDYFKKVSRYKTKNELISTLKKFLYNKTTNNFDSLLASLKKDNVDIRYYNDDNDIIIAKVNYDQIVKYGSDTSWCIVRSSYTFDSYNSSPLSQQFIIFLLDRNDNYAKIGVTTNAQGYRTAHLRDDRHLSLPELKDILGSRSVDISVIYPTKENALKIDWSFVENFILSDIGFSEEEIKDKKRKDIINLDWDKYPVEFFILNFFTKKEIVKRKKVYGYYTIKNPKKTDLEYFTKEEVEQYKLLDKTLLKVEDIKKYSTKEIKQKKLVDRTIDIRLEDLGDLGFSYEDILKISKTPKFKDDRLSKIISGKSRMQVVNLIKDHFMSSSIDYDQRNTIRTSLCHIVRINESDINMHSLLNCFINMHFINKIKFLDNFYDITKEDFNKIVGNKIIDYIYSIDNLNQKKYKNYAIDILSNIKDTNRDQQYTYLEMNNIKNTLYSIKNEDLYNYLYDLLRNNILNNSNRLYTLKIYSDRDHRSISVEDTLNNLDFWQIYDKYSQLYQYSFILSGDNVNLKEAIKIVNHLNKNGIDIQNGGIEFIEQIVNRGYSIDLVDIYIFCIENGIEVEKAYIKLISYLKKNNDKLKFGQIDKIKVVLNNKEEYIKEIDEITLNDQLNNFREDTLNTSGYNNRGSKMHIETWYTTYKDLLPKVKFNDNGYDEGRLLASTAIILSKLEYDLKGKISDLDNVDIKLYNTNINTLVKVILGVHTINGRNTWKIDLSEENRKDIYNWLNKKILSLDQESRNRVIPAILPCWYLYNKEELDKFLVSLNKLRNNYKYTNKNGIEAGKTFRMYELRYLVKYFIHTDNYTELENLFKKYTYSKAEMKTTIDNEHYLRVFGKTSNKYNILLKKYFTKNTNESYIMRWSDFR